ncbi:riboflavin synthase subunit alpha [Candidatus Kaiserbacteria bacterium RIFCSPHIGHO2_01_FULL_56_24]|uniref:Riboflavin synthase n=1 Tax=Candidatus Kaiserbacteria bacterium RIFCSPHIGHO2_01_FULL_56_24 TaxID=1798487 RepID=A0A1F6D8D0_9BACT|nr:MAG: riboflavin synthase subunit alpha [Candidatus Kaiserbacteria bacterium RIFCSPHIGHO2_01_FULL_56_24]
MFTGIIEAQARIIAIEKKQGMRVSIERSSAWKLTKGQSISIDGICSTVEAIRPKSFSVTYMPETLRVSVARDLAKGAIVNLERSLKVGDRIEGHIVQGHVDGVGIVTSVKKRGGSKELTIKVPRTLMRYIAPKGSITVQGTSLTLAARTGDSFTVALIPHTLLHTNLGRLTKGSRVNIETDLIARHLAALRGEW